MSAETGRGARPGSRLTASRGRADGHDPRPRRRLADGVRGTGAGRRRGARAHPLLRRLGRHGVDGVPRDESVRAQALGQRDATVRRRGADVPVSAGRVGLRAGRTGRGARRRRNPGRGRRRSSGERGGTAAPRSSPRNTSRAGCSRPASIPLCGVFARIGAVALNAVLDADVHVGETVAVFGQGVPGLLATQLARLNGGTVVAVDRLPRRLELAQSLGAATIVDATTSSAAETIKRLTGGRGADVVIELTGLERGAARGDSLGCVRCARRRRRLLPG